MADGYHRPAGHPRIGHSQSVLLAAWLDDVMNRDYPNRLPWLRDLEFGSGDPWIAQNTRRDTFEIDFKHAIRERCTGSRGYVLNFVCTELQPHAGTGFGVPAPDADGSNTVGSVT